MWMRYKEKEVCVCDREERRKERDRERGDERKVGEAYLTKDEDATAVF